MNIITQMARTDVSVEQKIIAIATAQGRNEKEERLAVLADDYEGRRIIDWCYNPFITFGVTWKKEPEYRDEAGVLNWCELDQVHNLLIQLAARDLSGNAAKEAIGSAFKALNPSAAKILWLCLNKDLKAGVAEASINTVAPGLIPIFAVMRAHTYEDKHVTQFPVVGEPKLDGNRVSFISRNGSGGFFTRTGKVIVSLDHMVPTMLKALRHWATLTVVTTASSAYNDFLSSLPSTMGIPDVMLDGEMMSAAGFNEANGALKRKTDAHDLTFRIFDMLSWAEFDAKGVVDVPYLARRVRVNRFVNAASSIGLRAQITQTPIEVLNGHDEIQHFYNRMREAGHEGAMIKLPNAGYEKRKSRAWLKMKAEDTEDLYVIGAYQGQPDGKYANTIGGLIVDRNGVEVRVSGISDADRAEMWRLWCETAEACGFSPDVGYEGASFKARIDLSEVPTILLGRMIEVEFHEVTPDGSLRHPRFIKFRDDKAGEVDK